MSNQLLLQGLLGFVNPLEWVRNMARSKARTKRIKSAQRAAIKAVRSALRNAIAQQFDLVLAMTPARAAEVTTLREIVSWSDQELVHLHDLMVGKALEDLKHARSAETRRDVLQWMAPAADGKAAFSFESCCAVAGLDPGPIRSFVKKEYLAEIKRFIAEDDAKAIYPVAFARG